MKLVVGLGNPGQRYEQTRHNLGFSVIDHLARQNNVAVTRRLCKALVGVWRRENEEIRLIKPQTFMNLSGESVVCLLREFRAVAADLVVVYDDLDLPFGRMRIRARGSAGGHRGMLSILEGLGDSQFYRVRVGIGRPPEGKDAEDYVLEPFNAEEGERISEVISNASQAVIGLLDLGGPQAMEKFNRAQ